MRRVEVGNLHMCERKGWGRIWRQRLVAKEDMNDIAVRRSRQRTGMDRPEEKMVKSYTYGDDQACSSKTITMPLTARRNNTLLCRITMNLGKDIVEEAILSWKCDRRGRTLPAYEWRRKLVENMVQPCGIVCFLQIKAYGYYNLHLKQLCLAL